MPGREKLAEFVAWYGKHISGDEKGQAQIFLNRFFQGWAVLLFGRGTAEFRVRKADEDGGGASFADYVWKPVVLIEMTKRRQPPASLLPGVRLLDGRANRPAQFSTGKQPEH